MENKYPLIISSAVVGGILEMYDFVIYAFLAPIISPLFFPGDNHSLSLILTFTVFAIGYFSRPLGGLIFGHLTDTRGRKKTLVVVISCMALSSLLIALLPTYATIGLLAPLLLLLFRIIQGLSVGGEFPNALVFLIEHAPSTRTGLFTSLLFFGINLGIVFAAILASVISSYLTAPALSLYGWRILFLVGALLGIIGLIIRSRLNETPVFQAIQKTGALHKVPLAYLLKFYKVQILLGIGIVCVMAVIIGIYFLFMPAYLQHYLSLPLKSALKQNAINVAVFSCLIPFVGYLSDLCAPKKVLAWSCVLVFILIYFAFYELNVLTTESWWIGFGILVITAALTVGSIPKLLASLFDPAVRASGVGLGYNIGFGFFGGIAPLVATSLLTQTHQVDSPAYFVMLAAVISFIAAICITKARVRDFAALNTK